MLRIPLFFSFMLILSSCGNNNGTCKGSENNDSVTYFCHMSTQNITHQLYSPDEVDQAPHPFYSNMSGERLYPTTDACGFGTFLFNPDTDELHFAISYSNLSGSAVMMHFHLGNPTVGGPIVQTIFGKPTGHVKGLGYSPEGPLSCANGPDARSGFVTGVYRLQGNAELDPPLTLEMEREALKNGELYVNIHTYLNEQGEIRGQLLPCHP